MELLKGIARVAQAAVAGNGRRGRGAWLALLVLLVAGWVPSAVAAPFDETFMSQPAGVPADGGPGALSFQMDLGGQAFVFSTPVASLVWIQGGIYLNDFPPEWTIRRADNAPFVVNRLDFDGSSSSGTIVTVQLRRSGGNVGAARVAGGFTPTSLSYSSVVADEILISGPDMFAVGLTRIQGDSEANPGITGLTPAAGPAGGGTAVVITGSRFTGATAVTFGGIPATGYTINSDTQITATSPAGAAGVVDVRVTGPNGTSAITAADRFTYVAAPIVTAISPTAGPTGGGTSVTITGTGFTGATAVVFGGTAASSYVVNSATQITATAPAGAAGTVDVRVTTPGGTSATSAADQYTYLTAPTVTSVSPQAGPTGGGTTVIITGTGFSAAPPSGAVRFGATSATYTINSNTQITATSPANPAGTYDVTVTTPGGTSATSAADEFTYVAAPVVTALSPTAGPTTGGTSVTITGTGFTSATTVIFGITAAPGFTIDSPTQITATAPAGAAGTVDVRVTTPGGTSATSAADQFTYVGAPTVTAVSPDSGPTGGGTTVIITGTGFAAVPSMGAVRFGASNATYTINSNTQITATSPANPAGTYDVTVTSVGGTSATSAADQYTYVGPPTVTAISPTAGPTSGGTTVTITGTGFSGATAVTFGGTAAPGYTVNSSTQITATAPARAAGTVDVRVTTPGGTSATSAADLFTYIAAPTVTAISPTAGPSAGGTSVTITGTSLSGATAVTFGGTPATGYTVNSGTQITATAPAGTGTVDVRVTTLGGTSATSAADQFTYIGAPTLTAISPAAGPVAGGTTVVITGAGFSGATAVMFGGTAATGYTINSNTQITATAPAGAAGTVDVRVTTAGGTSAIAPAGEYRYASVPAVTGLSPNAGPEAGGTAVVITGVNFTGATGVAFGASAAPGFTVDSATQITATSPAGTGMRDVRVTTPGGTSATGSLVQTFHYLPAPVVTADPADRSIAVGAGTTFSVTASNAVGYQWEVDDGSGFANVGNTGPYSGATTAVLTITGATGAMDGHVYRAVVSGVGSSVTSGTATLTVNAIAPDAPVVGTATATGPGQASVAFSAPAFDGGAAISGYTVTSHPGGLTGTGSASPIVVTGLTAGTSYTFTVTATNAAGTSPPSAASNAVVPSTALVAGPVRATVAYGSSGNAIALAISGTPTAVAVVDAPGHGTVTVSGTTLRYTPAPGYAGADSFSYSASDAHGPTPAAVVSITVSSPALVLGPATLPAAMASNDYRQVLAASGGAAPYRYAVTAGALPAGLSLSEAGVLSGTPGEGGSFGFSVTATDSSTGAGPFTAVRSYTLAIEAPALVLDLPELPPAEGGQAYQQRLTASGGTAPYRFALLSGALPQGLVLAESGEITGEPEQAGTFDVQVQVTDANGFTGSRAYRFVIQAVAQAISAFVATPAAPVYSTGGTFAVSANGGASGNPVVFASTTASVCAVQGTTVTMLSAGACVLTADQAGNALHSAAPQVRLEVAIASTVPVIQWPQTLARMYGEADFELELPRSTSPGAFTFSSANAAVATVNGRTVTLVGEGSTVITARQAASAGYAEASVQLTLVVAARPDPAADAQVAGSVQAQADASVRFAQVQGSNIRGRLRQVRSGSNVSSFNVALAYAGGDGVPGLSVPLNRAGDSMVSSLPKLPDGWGAWAAGTATFGQAGRGSGGFDFNTGGLTLGADRAVGDNLLLGMAGSWGRQDTEFDDSASRTDADQRSLAVYGLWRLGEHVFFDAMLAGGRLDFDLVRWSALAGASAHGRREGQQVFGALTFGYEHRGVDGTTLTGYGRYDGQRAELDGYREHGLGALDLAYGRQDVDTASLAVGVEGTHAFKGARVNWRPYWNVEYRAALENRSDVAVNYVQRPTARDYVLAMRRYNDDALSVGAGVDLQFDSGWMLGLLLGHERGRNQLRSHSIGLQVRYGSQGGMAPSRVDANGIGDADGERLRCRDTGGRCPAGQAR